MTLPLKIHAVSIKSYMLITNHRTNGFLCVTDMLLPHHGALGHWLCVLNLLISYSVWLCRLCFLWCALQLITAERSMSSLRQQLITESCLNPSSISPAPLLVQCERRSAGDLCISRAHSVRDFNLSKSPVSFFFVVLRRVFAFLKYFVASRLLDVRRGDSLVCLSHVICCYQVSLHRTASVTNHTCM